ncbi:peptidylprolyl isomerase [Sphingomonas mucosissima]|uniref:peptidylprolyl isomerase n=1 Tax=Sphingomonas mucosissima TaxID=370959 RepID=A0A245ZSB9_9SPHN|nr:peptidylprolyl isomerase [Sphingomonas mucosissima]OWK32641.1 peptidyl-prolyl cis-trans isomerase A precursor [Sphingomonas mucosissima]
MMHLVLLLALASGAPAAAQTASAADPDQRSGLSAAPPSATTQVTLVSDAGAIVLAIETEKAPATASNFLKYVDGRRLDGTSFYRTVKVQAEPRYGFIQFGTQNDPKRTLPPIPHEPTSKTGLSHVDGAISMAMAAPGSARGDFFIIVGNTPAMDAEGVNPGYAVFGRVIRGMDVVHKIMDMPTSATKGEGIMKGQMLEPTVPVKAARRTPASAEGPAS